MSHLHAREKSFGLTRWLCAASAIFVAGLAPAFAQTPQPEPGLPMWVVRDADSTIYITGTVHVLRDGTQWRSTKLDAALQESAGLWLEVEELGDSQHLTEAVLPFLDQFAAYDGPPLSTLLNADENAALAAKLKLAKAPPEAVARVDHVQPWFAAFAVGRDAAGSPFKFQNGIDNGLARIAADRGLPVHGMEKLEVQIALMAKASIDAQLANLKYVLAPRPPAAIFNDRLADVAFNGWVRGEVYLIDALKMFSGLGSAAAGAEDDVFFKRNEAWAGQIEEMLKDSGVSFIAVGAGHLVGKDSLQARLKLRGITAERY